MLGSLRDVSLIILIVPMLLCLLIPLAILFGSNWALRQGRKALAPKWPKAHEMMRRIDEKVDRAGEKVAAPFMAAEKRVVTIKAWWHYLRKSGSKSS